MVESAELKTIGADAVVGTTHDRLIRSVDPEPAASAITGTTPERQFVRVEQTTTVEKEVGGANDGDTLRTIVDNPVYNSTYGYVTDTTRTVTQPGVTGSWATTTNFDPDVIDAAGQSCTTFSRVARRWRCTRAGGRSRSPHTGARHRVPHDLGCKGPMVNDIRWTHAGGRSGGRRRRRNRLEPFAEQGLIHDWTLSRCSELPSDSGCSSTLRLGRWAVAIGRRIGKNGSYTSFGGVRTGAPTRSALRSTRAC